MTLRILLTPARLALSLLLVAGAGTVTASATNSTLFEAAARPGVTLTADHTMPNQSAMYPGDQKRSANGLYQLIFQRDGNLVIYRTDTQAVIWAADTDGKGGTKLYLQAAGNLVLSNPAGVAVWASQTIAIDGTGMQTYGRLEDDGRLQLHRNAGPIWSTPADPQAPAPAPTSARPTSASPTSARPTAPSPTSARPTSARPTPSEPPARPVPTTSSRPTPTAAKTDVLLPGSRVTRGNGLYSRNDAYVFGVAEDGDLVLMITQNAEVRWRLGKADQGGTALTLYSDGLLSLVGQYGAEIWNSGSRAPLGVTPRFVMQDDGNAVLYHGDTPVWATNTDQR